MDPEYFNQAFLPTRTHPPASLLTLPFELRTRILLYALKQKGTIELQFPVWAGLEVFNQPLFQVCRSLRYEALGAFYEANDFLWVIDVVSKRSDPSNYPITATSTSCLPWEYPQLLRRLRQLQINIYLPPNELDAARLETKLSDLVKSLDQGRRLANLNVLITAKRRAAQIPLSQQEVQALEVLGEMEVRGRVDVQTRYYFRAVSASVSALRLGERMKA